LYSCVVLWRVDVAQQLVGRPEAIELCGPDLGEAQDRAEVAGFESARLNLSADRGARSALITRDERLDATCRADPRAIGSLSPSYELGEQSIVEEGQIAGDDEHAIAARGVERRVDAADGARAGYAIDVDRETEVGEPLGISSHHEHLGGDPLQNLDLSNDDGTAMHDQAALVLTAKPSRLATGQNRGRRGPTLHESIMTEARIGRLLAACLHGAIADRLPQRLEYYEHWLTPDGLRDGNIGQAPISAVLGFLRTEGAAYDEVTFRAGELAALWTVASLTPSRRRWIGWLPRTWRARAALRVAAGIIRALQSSSRASTRVRRNSARVEVVSSLFCSVRETQATPLCRFYVAVAVETLRQFTIGAVGRTERCRAVGGSTCLVVLELNDAKIALDPALAA
jgi:hypothetical protein